jgi:hypothetical protein
MGSNLACRLGLHHTCQPTGQPTGTARCLPDFEIHPLKRADGKHRSNLNGEPSSPARSVSPGSRLLSRAPVLSGPGTALVSTGRLHDELLSLLADLPHGPNSFAEHVRSGR